MLAAMAASALRPGMESARAADTRQAFSRLRILLREFREQI
jgi:hypothetical protein